MDIEQAREIYLQKYSFNSLRYIGQTKEQMEYADKETIKFAEGKRRKEITYEEVETLGDPKSFSIPEGVDL